MIPDTYNGEQGYWNNGAWIPGSAGVSKIGEVCIGVTGLIRSGIIDIHTKPIHYNRSRSISEMSEEMERVFERQRKLRLLTRLNEKMDIGLICVGFLAFIAAIFLAWVVFEVIA